MLNKYQCLRCAQLFSRRWNFREHCRSQHNYDPFPKTPPPAFYPFAITGQKSGAQFIRRMSKPNTVAGLFAAADRFTTMMAQVRRVQELAAGHAVNRRSLDKMNLAESAINYMLDNYIVVPKNSIQGLSGFVCQKCMTFQLEYIKSIGYDFTAEGKHRRCMQTSVTEANKLQDNSSRLSHLYTESISIMENLIRLIFPGKKHLMARRLEREAASRFQAPDFAGDQMGSTHWAWPPIESGQVDITNSDLKSFLKDMMGSYALFTIPKGDYNDYYVVYITGKR